MLNKEIYQKDPRTSKLANKGVATVNDNMTKKALQVLRYELETFVCEGQYEQGMRHILETFLANLDQAQQPGVWVSGFFGSGKSHFVKMLRALWTNITFEDGATARGLAHLSDGIKDCLKELDTAGKRHGGLHAASGTLGSGVNNARLALLAIIFKSVGLPEQYSLANFVMWLKREGKYEEVRTAIEEQELKWEDELQDLYVSPAMHAALKASFPHLAASDASLGSILLQQFPKSFNAVEDLGDNDSFIDISIDEMIQAIRKALSSDGKFPLTLIVLDEVQQYISDIGSRSLQVQEIVEACSKNFGSKLLFVGTGQSAMSGTSNLKKLEGRFTVRVELSDEDVDSVVRQVILAKKPEAKQPIDEALQNSLGEISRHLSGTGIGHRESDINVFVQDYPLLPVRRRFWERALRILDQTSTASQLRNQLSVVHKAIQTNLDRPLGFVVPADFLYFDYATKLLQARVVPRKLYDETMRWIKEDDEEKQLVARACALIFLINKLHYDKDLGIRATVNSLVDLMLEDLASGSAPLRSKLPALLDKCDLVMKIDDEYRIQTEESAEWNDSFQNERSLLANNAPRIETERGDRMRKKFGSMVPRLSLTQGASKVSRTISPVFGTELPADASQKLCVWIRDGWNSDDKSVLADARQASNTSPVIFVFIPRRSADDLRNNLITFKAASATLDKRSTPTTPEGLEAKGAMETRKRTAEGKINELLDDVFSGVRVFQAGGNEIVGKDLQDCILKAADNALQRLYPKFRTGDHASWNKVYDKARQGAPDALKAVDYEGDVAKNPVCKELLAAIPASKNGAELRKKFESAPYGWSADTIDGGLMMLLVAGLVRAHDERGKLVEVRNLERKSIGKTLFKVESVTIAPEERIRLRKLLQKLGIQAKEEELSTKVGVFLEQLLLLAGKAGGEEPKPSQPDTGFIDELRRSTGNEQLQLLYSKRKEIGEFIKSWTEISAGIDRRWPGWLTLQALLKQAEALDVADSCREQAETIRQQRQLLEEPDPVSPLIDTLTQLLRDELNRLDADYSAGYDAGLQRLREDANWQKLSPEQRNGLLTEQSLNEAARPKVAVQTTEDILETLRNCPLAMFRDRIAAISGRFASVLEEAAELCEPKVQSVSISHRTLKTREDLEIWLEEVRKTLEKALANGPVRIR